MYLKSTKISASKTIGEISECLRDAGAVQIVTEYNDQRQESSLTFTLQIADRLIPFRLPVRTEALFNKIQRERSPRSRQKMIQVDREQAGRIAWRQILAWVRAQLALIQTGMVQAAEVFLSYVRMENGETYYQRLAARQFKALPGPEAVE